MRSVRSRGSSSCRCSAGRTPLRQRPGGGAAPALALIAAVTVVLAASLGVAGALGNASHSLQTFYASASHIYNWNDDGSNDPDDPGDLPFHQQYSFLVPICFEGTQTIYVFPIQAFFLVTFDPQQFAYGACKST